MRPDDVSNSPTFNNLNYYISQMAEIEIRKLDKEQLQTRMNIFEYESRGHYKVDIQSQQDGWTVHIKKEDFEKPFKKWDDTDKVVQPYKGDSEIYGAFIYDKEAGLIQFEYLPHNKTVRVWDIDIRPEFQHQGIGTALMNKCISRARESGARRMILEVQSSNLKAISFYRKMGFDLIGLDASHYFNDDIARKEVRLEMALHFD